MAVGLTDIQGIQRGHLATAQAHHPRHQIDAVDLLGDPVLHLETGVHFEKIGRLTGRVVYEFNRARTAIADGLHQRHGAVVQLAAHRLG